MATTHSVTTGPIDQENTRNPLTGNGVTNTHNPLTSDKTGTTGNTYNHDNTRGLETGTGYSGGNTHNPLTGNGVNNTHNPVTSDHDNTRNLETGPGHNQGISTTVGHPSTGPHSNDPTGEHTIGAQHTGRDTTGTGTSSANGPSTNTHANNTSGGGGGGAKAIVGKIEAAIGGILHNPAMKEKGLAKQEEAAIAKHSHAAGTTGAHGAHGTHDIHDSPGVATNAEDVRGRIAGSHLAHGQTAEEGKGIEYVGGVGGGAIAGGGGRPMI